MATAAVLKVDVIANTEQLQQAAEQGAGALDKMRRAAENAEFREWRAAMREGAQVTMDMRTPAEIYAQRLDRLQQLHKAGAIDAETFGRALRQAQMQMQAAGGAADKAAGRSDRFARSLKKLLGIPEWASGLGVGVAAVYALSRALDGLERGLRAVNERIADGETSLYALQGAFARQIPIVGQLYGALESLWSADLGVDLARQEARNKELQRTLDVQAEQRREREQNIEATRRAREPIEQLLATEARRNQELREGADALVQYELARRGGTAADHAALIALLDERDALQQAQAAREEATRRSDELRSAVEQTTAQLREELDTWGMSADEIARWRLEKQGAAADTLALIDRLQAERAARQELDEWQRKAQEVRARARTPAETLAAELAELEQLRARDLLDEETYARELLRIRAGLDPTRRDTPSFAAAVQSGSAEAYSARIQQLFGTRRGPDLQREALTVQQQIRQTLKEIRDRMAAGQVLGNVPNLN